MGSDRVAEITVEVGEPGEVANAPDIHPVVELPPAISWLAEAHRKVFEFLQIEPQKVAALLFQCHVESHLRLLQIMLTSAPPRVQDFPATRVRDIEVMRRWDRGHPARSGTGILPEWRHGQDGHATRGSAGVPPAVAGASRFRLTTNPGAKRDIERNQGHMTGGRGQDAHAPAGETPALRPRYSLPCRAPRWIAKGDNNESNSH